jgi:hypothetical protein
MGFDSGGPIFALLQGNRITEPIVSKRDKSLHYANSDTLLYGNLVIAYEQFEKQRSALCGRGRRAEHELSDDQQRQ